MFKTWIESIVGSKKLAAVLAGMLINMLVMLLQRIEIVLPDDVVVQLTEKVNYLLMAYVLGQGVADFGKDSAYIAYQTAQVEKEANQIKLDTAEKTFAVTQKLENM